MADLTIKKDDFRYNVAFTVQNSAGSAYSLSDYTVTWKIWKKGAPDTLLLDDGGCDSDETEGTCHYAVLAGDFDTVGHYKWELELTTASAKESTKTYDLEVIESG